ncbi:MAG: GGDEF domain-containing protein [Myxococcota bacterium]
MTPPTRIPERVEEVYSPWERHKLAVNGLSRLAMVVLAASGALLLSDVVLFRHGRPEGAWPGTWAWSALAVVVVGATALYVVVARLRFELHRPFTWASILVVAPGLAGGVAAVAAGGWSGPLGFGLVPVFFVWPLVMPGGANRAVFPLAAGLMAHVVVMGAGSEGVSAQVVPLLVLMVAAVGAAIGAAELVEYWRKQAAVASPTDWLTGALTKDSLVAQLSALCAHRARSLAPVSLVMFDIDRFKNVNDAFGRGAGDEVLEMLAAAVRAEIRAADFVGRYGDDEFLLVLDECEGGHAVGLVDRLRRRVSDTQLSVGGQQVRVTFSAGIVSVRMGEPLVPVDLLRQVEKALADSKETGRNRTALAPPPAPTESPETATMP